MSGRGGTSGGARGGASKTKDIQELGKYMNDKYGIKLGANLRSKDFNEVRSYVSGVEDVIREFPSAGKAIDLIDAKQLGPNTFGLNGSTYSPSGTVYSTIYLGNVLFGDKIDTIYAQELSTKHHPAGTDKYSVAMHEAGHSVEAALFAAMWRTGELRQRYGYDLKTAVKASPVAKMIINAAAAKLDGKQSVSPSRLMTLRRSISGYSATRGKPEETVAEAFADVVQNGSKATPFARAIYAELKRTWKQYFPND